MAVAVQTNKLDPLSISRTRAKTHSRLTGQDRSCYNSSNDRCTNKDDGEAITAAQASSYDLCHKIEKKDARTASMPFSRSVTPSMMASRPSPMTSESTSTPPPRRFNPSGIDKYDWKADPNL